MESSRMCEDKYFPLKTLKKTRKEQKCTQRMIANYLGVSIQYYSQMERGINLLSYANACKIAYFFHTTPDALFLKDYKEFLEQKKDGK